MWIVQGRQHKLSQMKSRVKGIPQLNSNDVYLVLSLRHNVSILGDRPFAMLKASFWVGSRALAHQQKVERAIATLEEVRSAHAEGSAKLRIYIEYQYSESFEFFTYFNHIDRV